MSMRLIALAAWVFMSLIHCPAQDGSIRASFVEVEVKLSPRNERLAGTLRVHVKGPISEEEWSLPEGLEIAKVTLNEQPANFRLTPQGFYLLATKEDSRQVQRLQIVFSGAPVEAATTWRVDEDGLPWIRLRGGSQAAGWHPWLPTSWQLPDTLWRSLILSGGIHPIGDGKIAAATDWPGGDKRWVIGQRTQAGMGEILIGNYVQFSNIQHTSRGLKEWHFWVPECRLESAQVHYAEVPAILRLLESHWGPLQEADLGPRSWVEKPGAHVEESRVYGRSAPGYSPALVREVAAFWIGAPGMASASPLREAMFQVAEWLWIQRQFSPTVQDNFAATYREQSKYWGAWLLLQLASQQGQSWSRHWEVMMGLAKDPTVADEDLRRWMIDHVSPSLGPVFSQYLDEKRLPVFEFQLEKKRKRWSMKYRWTDTVPGFSWTVEVIHAGKTIYLSPGPGWKEEAWTRGGGKTFIIDEAQGLFEIRSE